MAENLITQAELEAYAPNLDLSAYSAPTISGMISRASAQVQGYCQVDGFIQSAVANERDRLIVNTDGELVISFRRPRVAQGGVSALNVVTVDINQSLTLLNNGSDVYFVPIPGNYMIYPSNYLISFGRGLLSYRNAKLLYEISYVGGYAEIPDAIKEATTLYLQANLGARESNGGGTVKAFRQGSYSVQYNSGTGDNPLIKQAKAILDEGGYVRRVP